MRMPPRYDRPLLPDDEQQIRNYYVHVQDDGVEVVFADRPDNLVCLTVQRGGDWEFTTTKNSIRRDGFCSTIRPVPPRGEGWEVLDACADKWTGWRRLARHKVP